MRLQSYIVTIVPAVRWRWRLMVGMTGIGNQEYKIEIFGAFLTCICFLVLGFGVVS